MRLSTLFTLFSPLILPVAVAAKASSLTIQAWPLSSPSPTPIASVLLSSSSSASSPVARLESFTPLSEPKNPRDLIRIGIVDSDGKWHGSVAPPNWFSNEVDRTIVLHVGDKGDVYHIGVGTEDVEDPKIAFLEEKKKAKKDKKNNKDAPKIKVSDLVKRDGVTTVEVTEVQHGAMPVLNKPVVLNAEGKVEGQGPEEKTLFQKYWWVLVAFLAFNILLGGGGGEEGGK